MLRRAVLVALLPLVGFAGQLAATRLNPNGAFDAMLVVLSPGATGHFTQAGEIASPSEFLNDYASKLGQLRTHSHTHMPGAVLLFYELRRWFEAAPPLQGATEWVAHLLGTDPAGAANPPLLPADTLSAAFFCALVLMGLACLGAVPVYVVGAMVASRRAALYAAAMYLVLPNLLVFSPTLDQAYPLLATTALGLTLYGCRRRRYAALFAAGVVVSIGVAVSFAYLTLLLLLPLAGAIGLWQQRAGAGRFGIGGAGSFAAGLVGVQLTVYALWGVNVVEVFGESMRVTREVYIERFEKTYWKWLGYNLYDFFSFSGFAASGLWLVAVAGQLRRGRGLLRAGGDIDVLALPLAATLLAMDLAGVIRAETARLWLFLSPLVVLAAVRWIERRYAADSANRLLWLVLGLQLVQAVVFKCRLDVFAIAPPG